MQPKSHAFKQASITAIDNPQLQSVLARHRIEAPNKRQAVMAQLPDYESLRDQAVAIKNHSLDHLSHYLCEFEKNLLAAGGQIHWAETAQEANQIIIDICRKENAKMVTKGKSMVSEETGLNLALQAAGIEAVETDLGEYIIQLRDEPPSHITRPAMHLSRAEVSDTFRRFHTHLPSDRAIDSAADLLNEARMELREKFIHASVGITGANFLIAESGSTVIVTNEGNGDLTQSLPRVHIVLSSIEKIVPTFENFATIMRLLPRSATAQEITAYVTLSSGARQPRDLDGPEEFHVVLLDNGRSSMIGTKFHDMLRCIRCGACMNHCPVFHAVSGHAYGAVYPGPMGAVLTPWLVGLEEAKDLPNASSFCGRCESVCPMKIPLPQMMRDWRERQFERHIGSHWPRWGIGLWGVIATHPKVYRLVIDSAARFMRLFSRRGVIKTMPLANGWLNSRDLAAPDRGGTFMQQLKRRGK